MGKIILGLALGFVGLLSQSALASGNYYCRAVCLALTSEKTVRTTGGIDATGRFVTSSPYVESFGENFGEAYQELKKTCGDSLVHSYTSWKVVTVNDGSAVEIFSGATAVTPQNVCKKLE